MIKGNHTVFYSCCCNGWYSKYVRLIDSLEEHFSDMIFSALINNITLIISLSILYSFIVRRWKYGSRTGQAISGFLFGAVAVVGMMNPLIISPGLIFDGRSIIISFAGFIGGWGTALIAALMGIIYRTWLGGPGTIMGVSVIASSAAIGIVYHYIRRCRPRVFNPLHLLGFGIIVHICMLAMTMILPSGMRYEVFSNIAIPVMLIYPIGTLLVGLVFLELETRIRAEEALRESEVKYRQLYTHAPAAIYEVDFKKGKFTQINSLMCEYSGYSREELLTMSVLDIVTEESQRLFLERLEKIGKGESVSTNPEFCIKNKNGSTRWLQLNIKNIYREGIVVGASVVAHDIAERKRSEADLQRTLESLRKAFGTIIQVMVSAVEARDPYTSGHQLRSADLSRAIATEMGLPQEKIDGIRMAGSIHDIGKLSIPAEILSKPTKLTDIEFSLIKEHSRKGYEMLKDVESPWPLAQMIYQHHERMDGSGYPNGLKGEEILLESRILSVADVVEAMASHRPYRPGLGLDKALKEIGKNRGTLYDPEAVDVCLRLFNEKCYKLVE
jgi:PAS domain S-box-containing protein